jgi:baseplate J-like protein
MIYVCCDERRRDAVRAHGTLNGIDFLEVFDDLTLLVHFLKPLSQDTVTREQVRIEGGERIRDVAVTETTAGTGAQANVLTVQVDKAGDFSIYTLRLIQDAQHPQPPAGFDPLLAAVTFSFRVDRPMDFDCQPVHICPPTVLPEPEINYLAKDYGSLRRLLLDRLTVLMPDWTERHAADLGVTLVELLAYVGDYLSYQQDAIATEAYLGTARRRVSVRRHARLVDYVMHDGCNARAWVQIQVDGDNVTLPQSTPLLTRIAGQPVAIVPESAAHATALATRPEVFETMHPVVLFTAHNALPFYTWGARECCLPAGATRATLGGHFPDLHPGDVLVFEEVLGPDTGSPNDANPAHRYAVRLRTVTLTQDPLGGRFAATPTDSPVNITEIAWAAADALPFPVCISARTDVEHGQQFIADVSIARGNMVLADHGLTRVNELLGSVPEPVLFRTSWADGDHCQPGERVPLPPRFRPRLSGRPLTHAAPYDAQVAAYTALYQTVQEALPAIALTSVHNTDTAIWLPKRDLLNSDPTATEFVVEIETDGTACLRFGDDQHGARPASQTAFTALYRVGNGLSGNVGAEALAHVVTEQPHIIGVRNPLPAQGGVDPESIETVRQRAPYAFRTQERAVTPEDYAAATARHVQVQRAAATLRWTGSWHTAFVTVDRLGGLDVDAVFEAELRQHLERYRMAGYDLEIDGPRFVPLEIDMQVLVQPNYFRSDVKAALLEVFSNRTLPDGRRGAFHPDQFTFGQPVYLSRLYAAAYAVPGVASVNITAFQRQGQPDRRPLEEGKLSMERLEIARLDNDLNFPERGVFRLQLQGGK